MDILQRRTLRRVAMINAKTKKKRGDITLSWVYAMVLTIYLLRYTVPDVWLIVFTWLSGLDGSCDFVMMSVFGRVYTTFTTQRHHIIPMCLYIYLFLTRICCIIFYCIRWLRVRIICLPNNIPSLTFSMNESFRVQT